MKVADKEDGVKSGVVSDDTTKLRERINVFGSWNMKRKSRRAVAYLYRDVNSRTNVPAGPRVGC